VRSRWIFRSGRVGSGCRAEHPPGHFQIRGAAGAWQCRNRPHAALDGTQRVWRLPLNEARPPLAAEVSQCGLQVGHEPLRREGLGLVLVDDAPRARLVGRRQRTHGVSHIGVEQGAERVVRLPASDSEQQEEQLLLPFGEIPKGGGDHRDVEFALSLFHCCGMRPCRLQVAARRRTPDLHEPLGTAADRADILTDAWARTPRLPGATEGTNHVGPSFAQGTWAVNRLAQVRLQAPDQHTAKQP